VVRLVFGSARVRERLAARGAGRFPASPLALLTRMRAGTHQQVGSKDNGASRAGAARTAVVTVCQANRVAADTTLMGKVRVCAALYADLPVLSDAVGVQDLTQALGADLDLLVFAQVICPSTKKLLGIPHASASLAAA